MTKKFNPFVTASLILVLILAIIIAINILKLDTNRTVPPAITPTPVHSIANQAKSVLSLLPNPISLDQSGIGTINAVLETNSNKDTAIQLELKYDPNAITEIAITPGDLFNNPVELIKNIDSKNGRITYALGISPTQLPVEGKGTAAIITFRKKPGTILASTKFIILPESLVTATGIEKSVLKESINTKILLSQ